MSDLAARKLPSIDLDDFERRLRHVPQQSDAQVDPLSELARLVAMDDPFKSMFDSASARTGIVTQAPPVPAQEQGDYYAAPQQHASVGAGPGGLGEQAWHDAQAQHAEQARHEAQTQHAEHAQHADQTQHATHAYPAQAFHSDDRPHHDSLQAQLQDGSADGAEQLVAYRARPSMAGRFPRKAMIAGLSLSVVALAGVAALAGFRGLPTGKTAQDLPVIKAAVGPAKVQPPQSATEIAAATSVLDKTAPADGVANAKIVSREEQPTVAVTTVKTVKLGEAGAQGGVTGLAVAPAPSPSVATMPEPRRVKTVLVRPDGSIIGEPPVRPAAAPQTAALVPNESGLTPAARTPEVKAPPLKTPDAIAAIVKPAPTGVVIPVPPAPKTTARIVPAAPVRQPVAEATAVGNDPASAPMQLTPPPQARGKPVKVAARDVPAAPAAEEALQATGSTAGGAFSVQLAAPGSEQEAKDTSARLLKQYAAALGSYQPSIRKASDKDVFRVRVSNLSKDEADALCGKLKAAGSACFVARN